MRAMNWLGVDTGGTFTDFVLLDEHRQLRVHKVLSTPDAPERAILQGIQDLAVPLDRLRVVHGSTVATNAALEGKGVRTAFVTNRGFADVLSIGRQNRRELYNLTPELIQPPVPSELCLQTGGRLSFQGEMLEALTDDDLAQLTEQLVQLEPEAVAVNLLFSYLSPKLEQRLKQAIPKDCFVSLSSEVLPELGEYERGMATWLNAWVGPLVQGYLKRLSDGLNGVPVSVMQSSGETVAADQAGRQAVRMLLSGPAGGLVGARYVAALSDCTQLLTFDMGGTSTDVALIEGDLQLTNEGKIGHYPVAVPMMDMHTIGAGGGSIAWIDDGGMLQLGPQSAGADPGPACYGRGGKLPTATDANLLLGRLQAGAFLGGDMSLDEVAAQEAMRPIAQALDCDLVAAARHVIDVANAHMARALRAISIKRGVDARAHTLVSFGGAGGLHVCELADQLEMRSAMVPAHGGVLSALGMLAARPGRQLSRSLVILLDEQSDDQITTEFEHLADQGLQALAAEYLFLDDCEQRPSVDLRYRGQSYTLNIPWQGSLLSSEAFHALHEARYGHRMSLPIELVTLRLAVLSSSHDFQLPESDVVAWDEGETCVVADCAHEVRLYQRQQLSVGMHYAGPAVIAEQVATTWLAPGWNCKRDLAGNLLLSKD